MRLAKNFKQEDIVNILYCALVRPILEYGYEVWDRYTAGNCIKYKRIQYAFLIFAKSLLNITYLPHNNNSVAMTVLFGGKLTCFKLTIFELNSHN